MTLTAVLHEEGGRCVAEGPELGTVSQGDTIAEALASLKEASELYLEEVGSVPVPFSRPLVTTFEAAGCA
jgi:predicted RNase H-like HicB family nuclease